MAVNDIRICDKCKHMKIKSMMSKIAEIAPGTNVSVGCKSYCGPCSRFAFIYINGRYITGATEDEAVEKMKKHIKR
jgi:uncharacterized protein YuzB (UPF0349 family)